MWLKYIDDISFIWTEGKNKLESYLKRLNTFHPNLKLTQKKSETSVNFLEVLSVLNLKQIFIVSPLIVISFSNLTRNIPFTSKHQLFIVKGYVLKDYVRRHWHLKTPWEYTFLGLGNVIITKNLLASSLEGY